MVRLGSNRYGKAEVRVVHVARSEGSDDLIRDWTVSSALSGDVAACYLTGDNASVLTTDAQKNTVYGFSQRLGDIEPEAFATALAEHFVATQEPITRARVAVLEHPWARIGTLPHSFARTGAHTRSTVVIHDAEQGTSVVGGVEDLVVLNTTNSEFWGFPRDEYTTLPETQDRMLATQVSASWRFASTPADWGAAFDTALATLLATFGGTYSYSLQQTLYAIGEAIIGAVPEICEVRLVLPNKHHFLVDLTPFGQGNDNEVYYAADRPYGLIEGQVLADDAPPEGLAWT
ncbi:factor-independent urate hydroxylase [Jatrophihabitans sp.]|uniref:factor-independent urate hydroxylase n=1 Tax=Jatrophihabitans sp. TaxID=1932789 RepID=UPI0030C688A1|nr:Uricase [Jatrophihabitans sp.]